LTGHRHQGNMPTELARALAQSPTPHTIPPGAAAGAHKQHGGLASPPTSPGHHRRPSWLQPATCADLLRQPPPPSQPPAGWWCLPPGRVEGGVVASGSGVGPALVVLGAHGCRTKEPTRIELGDFFAQSHHSVTPKESVLDGEPWPDLVVKGAQVLLAQHQWKKRGA